jgi:MoxR-like ATPase
MNFSESDINQARERIVDYHSRLNQFFIDRGEILKLMMTAVIAQEPMLFIGRPGTAKSLLVSTFCDGLGLSQTDYFEYMLTKFTEPSEVMGPVDIAALKNGQFIRKITGYLPQARIAFLDEIFKANSAILNLLLTVINERKFYQEGNPVKVPLICLFAASNEIPDFGEFDALKDRFILKVETLPVKDSHFFELLQFGVQFENKSFQESRPWKSDCTLDDFVLLNSYVSRQVLPQFIAGGAGSFLHSERMSLAFRTLLSIIEQELKVEITDRKLIKLYKLIVTQAFLFNGGKVTKKELSLLRYCGNNFKDIRKLRVRLDELLEHV